MEQLTLLETDTVSESVENPISYESNSKCSVPNCKNKIYRKKAYCRKHYFERFGAKCLEFSCNRLCYAHGYCKKHYEYKKRHGELKVKEGNYGKHNFYGSSEYVAWCNMKSRCDNPKKKEYQNYGGKGITYCDRWKLFENFLIDMGKKPSKDHSLDRIDPYGNYCPENCRWTTSFVQSKNKCKHRILKYNGLEMTEKEWITFLYNETIKLESDTG